MNLFAIYASVTSLFLLERLAKVTLYGTLATAVPFYNISILCNRNKTKEQIYNFSESSKSRMKRLEEFHEKMHAAREQQFGHSWDTVNGRYMII